MKVSSTRNMAAYSPENATAYNSGKAAKAAPPPRMNQTWLPSQTGPMLLMVMRRSSSSRATNRSCAATPRSNPSMTAKPVSSTARNSHQMRRRISYSLMSGSSCACGAALFGCDDLFGQHVLRPHQDIAPHEVDVHHRQRGVEDHEADEAAEHLHPRDARRGELRRQYAFYHPRLTPGLSHNPPQFSGDPG